MLGMPSVLTTSNEGTGKNLIYQLIVQSAQHIYVQHVKNQE